MASKMPVVERGTMILCTRGSSGMHSHTKGNKWSLHGVQLLIKTHSFVHYSFHPHSTTKWFDCKRFIMDKSLINVADQSLPCKLQYNKQNNPQKYPTGKKINKKNAPWEKARKKLKWKTPNLSNFIIVKWAHINVLRVSPCILYRLHVFNL